LNPGDKVPDSGSKSANPGGDPTKLAAVGGGRKVSSKELCNSTPGTALFSSSMIYKLLLVESVDGAFNSSCSETCIVGCPEWLEWCIEAVVEAGVDSSEVFVLETRFKACPLDCREGDGAPLILLFAASCGCGGGLFGSGPIRGKGP